jgi:hypothetical protein
MERRNFIKLIGLSIVTPTILFSAVEKKPTLTDFERMKANVTTKVTLHIQDEFSMYQKPGEDMQAFLRAARSQGNSLTLYNQCIADFKMTA